MQLFQLIYQLQKTQTQETESILEFISTKSEEEKKKPFYCSYSYVNCPSSNSTNNFWEIVNYFLSQL